jgi:CheY-like chemotaxis protein
LHIKQLGVAGQVGPPREWMKQMLAPSSTSGRMLRVLHVDDHAANRQLVRDILSAHGHESAEACSGLGAMALLASQRFDAVLMDINMPGMGGVEVVRLMRRAGGPACLTPVIACTSDTRRTESHYLALGFNGYIAKPFSVTGLMDAVNTAVNAALHHTAATTQRVA